MTTGIVEAGTGKSSAMESGLEKKLWALLFHERVGNDVWGSAIG